MSRDAGSFLNLCKAFVEFTVNAALTVLSPPPQRRHVPVVALADREWARAMARRRQLGHL